MLSGCEGEEILNKEFSFENFNNMTSGNGLILLKQDHGRNTQGHGAELSALGDGPKPLFILPKPLCSVETPGLVFFYD